MSQPISTMLVAMIAAITSDVTLAAMLTGVFSGRAPKGQALNYIVVPDMRAEGQRTFATAIKIGRGEIQLRIWAQDFVTVGDIYKELERVLDRKKLTVAGHYQVAGKVTLRTTIADPGDAQAAQGVVSYEWTTHTSP